MVYQSHIKKLGITLLICIQLNFISLAQCKTLNPLFSSTENFTYKAAATIDDKLIYRRTTNESDQLWVYESSEQEPHQIITLKEPTQFNGVNYRFTTNHDRLYYFNRIESNGSGIWVSDLSTSGTVELPAIPDVGVTSFSPIVVKSGHVFTQGITPESKFRMIHLDDTALETYPVDIYDIENVCVFTPDNIIVIEDAGNGEDYALKRVNNGEVSELLNLNINTFRPEIISMFVHQLNCLVVYESIDGTEVIRIRDNGQVSELNNIDEIADARIYELFSFKDRVYALGRSQISANGAGVYKLSEDLQSIETNYSTDNTGFFSRYSNPKSGRNFLTLNLSFSTDPPAVGLHYFDENLNLLDTPFTELQGRFLPSPDIFSFQDEELYLFNLAPLNIRQDLFFIDDIGAENAALIRQRNLKIQQVFTGENNHIGYANVTDQTDNKEKIYAIEDYPRINKQLTGAWRDVTRENQGMMINKGTRANGSEYLFVSIYTFRNGGPLWLAGIGEITSAQTNISMPLFEFDGLDEFEQNVIPNKMQYGFLSLDVVGCNNIIAEVSTDKAMFILNLKRINDVSFANICAD